MIFQERKEGVNMKSFIINSAIAFLSFGQAALATVAPTAAQLGAKQIISANELYNFSVLDLTNAPQYATNSTQNVLKYYQQIDGYPRYLPATGKVVFVFDPGRGQYGLYEPNGKRIKTGIASGGANYCPDVGRSCRTPVGIYSVFHKKGYHCTSSKYPLDKSLPRGHMPYCMYFHKAGFALHGHQHVPNYNASHGCVRLKQKDAEWLYSNAIDIGTVVVIRPYH